ncbi:hypothetical protein Hs30E_15320 [Lactococcus hodotermopsidis]|uniref:Cupin 2 conserved barrel domain-containing protein n=1 Tax=Pseudolactococcus hodotermopsidis TaxID=2709157 RepID=A0A6A0BFD1_9LACT|nr:cupin domain-containing protein [Lactococcus hodotermopsidis]GFH42981.1 hypothetical protein Hs30E_15320 [Lactococcus hodotermopsidis]
MPVGVVQDWHKHVKLDENIIVTSGEITIEYLENGKISSKNVRENDVLRVKKSIHRISNLSSQTAKFIVFRFVPTGKDKRGLTDEKRLLMQFF